MRRPSTRENRTTTLTRKQANSKILPLCRQLNRQIHLHQPAKRLIHPSDARQEPDDHRNNSLPNRPILRNFGTCGKSGTTKSRKRCKIPSLLPLPQTRIPCIITRPCDNQTERSSWRPWKPKWSPISQRDIGKYDTRTRSQLVRRFYRPYGR